MIERRDLPALPAERGIDMAGVVFEGRATFGAIEALRAEGAIIEDIAHAESIYSKYRITLNGGMPRGVVEVPISVSGPGLRLVTEERYPFERSASRRRRRKEKP